jgi:hypothetical protein
MVLPDRLLFLKSVRFWKLVVLAVLLGLEQAGTVSSDLALALTRVVELILGGSIMIRTVDRFGENVGTK